MINSKVSKFDEFAVFLRHCRHPEYCILCLLYVYLLIKLYQCAKADVLFICLPSRVLCLSKAYRYIMQTLKYTELVSTNQILQKPN